MGLVECCLSTVHIRVFTHILSMYARVPCAHACACAWMASCDPLAQKLRHQSLRMCAVLSGPNYATRCPDACLCRALPHTHACLLLRIAVSRLPSHLRGSCFGSVLFCCTSRPCVCECLLRPSCVDTLETPHTHSGTGICPSGLRLRCLGWRLSH